MPWINTTELSPQGPRRLGAMETLWVYNALDAALTFEVRDAQNYFGPPVSSGVYGGGMVSLPMTGTAVSAPVGDVPKRPTHTLKNYGAFVVLPGKAPRDEGTVGKPDE